MEIEKLSIGARVQDIEGSKATVRYIGPVAASKNKSEIWVGVEWDDKSRGKHDGSCVDSEGKFHRYFECEMGAGSFVKSAKLSAMYGFYDALNDRYVSMDAPLLSSSNVLPDAFVCTAKGKQKVIEFVGEMKIRKRQQIHLVTSVAMRGAGITNIGDSSHNGIAAHLTDVDLQDNLLWSWEDVSQLCKHMPHLQTLQLHGNRMQAFTSEIASSLSPTIFSSLRVLALNHSNFKSWCHVLTLSTLLSNLEELYLSANDFSDMTKIYSTECNASEECVNVSTENDIPLPTVFKCVSIDCNSMRCVPLALPCLKVIDISYCNINSWLTIATALKPCTALSDLVIDGNPIENLLDKTAVSSALNINTSDLFMNLQRISCSHTKLSSWSDIDCLATYDSIKNFRCTRIPLFNEKGVSEIRPEVVGRMEHLEFFNGSNVSSRERTESERIYLRRIARQLLECLQSDGKRLATDVDAALAGLSKVTNLEEAAKSDPFVAAVSTVLLRNRRYNQLYAKYGGDLVMSSDGAGQLKETLSEDLVTITFHNICISAGANMTSEPITKKLPSSIQVSMLKKMVKSIFYIDLPVHLLLLSLRVYKDAPPLYLDDDTVSLSYHGVPVTGGEIFINQSKEKK